MFQLPSDEDKKRKFFRTLATNKVAYDGFLDYLRDEVEEQQHLLESAAIAALLDANKRDIAQVQLGKLDMVKAILSFAEQFTK